jgi:hypothetical protein
MMRSSRTAVAALLMLLAAPAFATKTKPPVDPPAPSPQPVDVDASAAAHATAAAQAQQAQLQGQLQAQGQTLRNSNTNTLAATGGAGGSGGAGGAGGAGGLGGAGGQAAADAYSEGSSASGVGNVDVGGDSTRYRSTAIALSVPGATAAPAVPGECLRHTSGWSAGMGVAARSGATKFDREQCDRVHCLAIADRYAHAGLIQAMADQLASCGGVKGVEVREVVPPAGAGEGAALLSGAVPVQPAAVTPEDLAAMEQRLAERIDRQFVHGLGK